MLAPPKDKASPGCDHVDAPKLDDVFSEAGFDAMVDASNAHPVPNDGVEAPSFNESKGCDVAMLRGDKEKTFNIATPPRRCCLPRALFWFAACDCMGRRN